MRPYWLHLSACTLLLLFGAHHARAQGMDAQRFVPAAGAAGGLMVERPVVPPHLGLGAGLFLNFADDALTLKSRSTGDDLSQLSDNALALDLLGSIGLFDRIELALHLPISLWQDGESYATRGVALQAGGGVGDLRFVPKGVFYRSTGSAVGVAIGAALPVTFPTGNGSALRGAEAFTLEPRLLFGLLGERWNLSTSVGVRLRTSTGDDDLVGHEITYGIGGAVSLIPQRDLLDLLLELVGSADVSKSKPEATGVPLELLGAAVVKPHPSWHIYAGFGAGLVDGLGTPDFRAILGLRFASRRVDAYKDTDNDGIADRNDRCPTSPEDYDGFEDEDGCAELDNDHDGIPDDSDECPDVAEEPGGDRDGCPDKGRVVVKHGKIIIIGKVQFEIGSDRIQGKSEQMLDEVAAALNAHNELGRIRIEGHSDDVGDEDFNQKLSEKRAESVRRALIKRGVPASRLTVAGYGESKPIAPNSTPAGRAKNRRVEFVKH